MLALTLLVGGAAATSGASASAQSLAVTSGSTSGAPMGSPLPGKTTGVTSGQTTGAPSASSCGHGTGQTIANPLKFCSLDQVLSAVLDAAIALGTVILTLALIYTGFRFVMARGNEGELTKAKQALLWTIIGGLILLGAKAIQIVISDTVTSLTP